MNSLTSKVTVIGLGYVGLPLALVMADKGAEVNGFDTNQNKINLLNSGATFLDEEELINLWNKNNKKIKFSSSFIKSDVYLIAVPTPLEEGKITCDMKYIDVAIHVISNNLKKGDKVILVSTCPVGSVNHIAKLIFNKSRLEAGRDYALGYCPERLYPGDTYDEIINNEHIIGGYTKICGTQIADFYREFISIHTNITRSTVAELSKLAENAYRDVNIAFANELAEIAYKYKENVDDVIGLSNLHPRVKILDPGVGVGGHCLPIDPWFLIPYQQKSSFSVIRAARKLNDQVPHSYAKRIIKMILNRTNFSNKKGFDVALLGYTYKPESSDLRESPAKLIIEIIKSHSFNVYSYDPFVDKGDKKENVIKNLQNSSLIILLVEHIELQEICKNVDYISWRDIK